MLDDEDLALWVAGLDDLFALVASRFPRVEPRLQARAYVRGLLAPLAVKNSWTLAEAAGNKTPDKVQRLLNRASWDDGGVRDDVRGYVARHLGDAGGVLIVDETGFVKGTRSAGVQRQYSGTAGRVENCQLGVFLAYASPKGRALVDRYLGAVGAHNDVWVECRKQRANEAGNGFRRGVNTYAWARNRGLVRLRNRRTLSACSGSISRRFTGSSPGALALTWPRTWRPRRSPPRTGGGLPTTPIAGRFGPGCWES